METNAEKKKIKRNLGNRLVDHEFINGRYKKTKMGKTLCLDVTNMAKRNIKYSKNY